MALNYLFLTLHLLSVVPSGCAQDDIANRNTPGTFFLDSNADCNGPVRELYGQSARVIGQGADQSRPGPQSCTLKLKSTSTYEQTNIAIEVVRVTINQDNVRFTMYDGDEGSGVLRAYDKNSQNKPNERFYVTSGNTVTFILERQDITNSLFDIEVVVTPISSGVNPGYENNYGTDYGFFREKIPNEAVVGIIGAILAICLILIIIFVAVCQHRYKGLHKPWEQHQLSSFQAPSYAYETKSGMSDASSNIWASNMSRRDHPARPHSRMPRQSEDVDSVFDDDMPPKKQLLELERERDHEKSRYIGRPSRGQFSNTFVQADDDHPQDTFVERVIVPRVRQHRNMKPPSYSEAVSDTETETDKTEIEEEEDDNKDEVSEEEEEESQAELESEAETSHNSDEDEEEAQAPRPVRPPQAAGNATPTTTSQPPYPPYQPVQYVGGYPMMPSQFVPVMAAPLQPQFHPLVAGPGFPPPRYPGGTQPQKLSIKPTDPPVYSYLVQRGYTPLDGRHSPASSANTSQVSDDRDSSQLHSGVEYMRR